MTKKEYAYIYTVEVYENRERDGKKTDDEVDVYFLDWLPPHYVFDTEEWKNGRVDVKLIKVDVEGWEYRKAVNNTDALGIINRDCDSD